jgi:hypothetical protein
LGKRTQRRNGQEDEKEERTYRAQRSLDVHNSNCCVTLGSKSLYMAMPWRA